jgi:hypothetical protein
MRLLICNNNSIFSLKNFGDDTPRYAILLHTWGADVEEVTFRDLIDGTGQSKAGYEKIKFCGAGDGGPHKILLDRHMLYR